jgi:hypothetical protein
VAILDLASVLGLILCAALVVFGILYGNPLDYLGNFYDVPSIMITFGGAFCCVLIMAPDLKTFLNYLKSFALILKVRKTNEEDTIRQIIALSNIARKEGLLALEEAANGIDDEFLKKGFY